ncbi:MAG: hypothetical protein ACKVKJ_05270 [Fidelibacterota bacterium]
MKSKLMKMSSLFLAGVLMFSACEDDKTDSVNGDIVGTWKLIDLSGTYTRTVDTDEPISHNGQWNYAEAILGAQASLALIPFITHNNGDVMTGFPVTSSNGADGLAAAGINMTLTTQDATSDGEGATYTLTGKYPTIRTDLDACRTAATVADIEDQGKYWVDWGYPGDKYNSGALVPNLENFMIQRDPAITGSQVLPPFHDGSASVALGVNGAPDVATLTFLDRDSHSDRYAEVMSTWSEADDRVVSAVFELPVDPNTGAFSTEGTPAAEGYVMNAQFAPWTFFWTWYAMNVVVQTQFQAADVKNPLTDLDGDGTIGVSDMVVFMHMDNLAGGGGATALGMPFTALVDSSDPAMPVIVNDSQSIFDPSGGAATMATGGKLTYVIGEGTCFNVDETIQFNAKFERIAE